MASMPRLAAFSSLSDEKLGSRRPLQHPTESEEAESILLDRPVGQGGTREDALGSSQSETVEGGT